MFFLGFSLCIYKEWGIKEGSLRRWPVARTDQELQKLPSSDAFGMHEKATKIGVTLGVNKNIEFETKLRKNLLETLIVLRHCLLNCLKKPQKLR